MCVCVYVHVHVRVCACMHGYMGPVLNESTIYHMLEASAVSSHCRLLAVFAYIVMMSMFPLGLASEYAQLPSSYTTIL